MQSDPQPDFRALFEAVPGRYLVLLPDAPRFTIVAVTDSYLEATMTARADILGRGLFEVFPDNPADPGATGVRNLAASLERVLQTRADDAMAVQKYDIRRPEAQGGGFEERYWSPCNAPVLAADGSVLYLVHCVEDVTDFVRVKEHENAQAREIFRRAQQVEDANRRLHALNLQLAALGETQFRALFNFMPQLGWTARPDGYVDFYNQRWYEFTGTTFAEMQGWGWQSVHDPEVLPRVVDDWRAALAAGEPWEMEFPLRRHDGAFRWFLTRVAPIRDDGKIVRWVGINTDIHERKVAGVVTEQRLHLLIESIRDYAVYMVDPTGRVLTWNPGAERLKGYRADEVIGRHFSMFYLPEDVAARRWERDLATAARAGRFEAVAWRARKDGSRYRAHVIISAVRDESGALIGFAKVTRDLTAQHEAEEERVRLAKAQEAVRLRDEFLSIASHELKTPLTSLQLQVSGIQRNLRNGAAMKPEKLAPRMAVIEEQVRRLTNLIDDLLDVSRVTAGRLRLDLADVDLAEVVRDAVERLHGDLRAAGCSVITRVEAPIVGRWDRMRLDQIVTNFLTNAMKYGGRRPIEIDATVDGPRAILSVRDHGIGISTEDQRRIFERFGRAVSSEHYGGLGLGLWIVKQLVDAMGGAIRVESAPGEGARFTVELPLAAAVDERPTLH